ncbi:DUF2062 domain-containing protein [Natranaerobius trueperi]|nr:DUF2062 domain-containing protein [Natranaerobius trueperi]
MKKKIEEVLKLESTPKKIALGAAIAVFWNFLPSLGVGPFLSAFAARVLGGSIVAAVTINLGTGVLIPIFYTLNIMMGRLIIGENGTNIEVSELFNRMFGNIITYFENSIGESEVQFLLAQLETFSVGFFVGAMVNSLIAAVFLYILCYHILIKRKTKKLKLENY